MQKLSNLGDVINPAVDAYRAGQQRADQVRKQNALAELGNLIQSGAPLRQAAAQGLANGVPLSAFTSVSQLGNQDRAYGRQVERDAVGDQRFEQQFDFRKQRAEVGDEQFNQRFELQKKNAAESRKLARDRLAMQQAASNVGRPNSKIGKLRQDLKKGLITQEDFNAEIASHNAPGVRIGPNGRLTAKLSENQSKLTLWKSQMSDTAPVLNQMEEQFNPANIPDAAARSLPIAGNFFQSSEGQQYTAAAAAWAEGALRIATGAAATQPEIERNLRTYFAEPGDTPDTIAFKSNMREMYSRSIRRALGEQGVPGKLPNPTNFANKFVKDAKAGKMSGVTSSGLTYKAE